MAKFKSENLLAVSDFKCYGSSVHAKEINSMLKETGENKFSNIRITKQRATDMRDYLMLSLRYFNYLRASNLMSITL